MNYGHISLIEHIPIGKYCLIEPINSIVSCIPSLSIIGEHFRLVYAPQMLPSLMEVSNSAKDQTIRMIALALETDDAIPPAEVLPGCTGGVSFVRWSCRRLLLPFLQVSVRTDVMTGNNYVMSVHVLSRLLLAIHQPGAMSTSVGMTIYFRYVVVNLASPGRRGLQRSSPFSRRNSARLKGAYSLLAPKRSRPLGFWTFVTDYSFPVIKSMTTGGTN